MLNANINLNYCRIRYSKVQYDHTLLQVILELATIFETKLHTLFMFKFLNCNFFWFFSYS